MAKHTQVLHQRQVFSKVVHLLIPFCWHKFSHRYEPLLHVKTRDVYEQCSFVAAMHCSFVCRYSDFFKDPREHSAECKWRFLTCRLCLVSPPSRCVGCQHFSVGILHLCVKIVQDKLQRNVDQTGPKQLPTVLDQSHGLWIFCFTAYSLPMHYLITAYALRIHCVFTAYFTAHLTACCTVDPLHICCLIAAHPLSIHYLFTVYSTKHTHRQKHTHTHARGAAMMEPGRGRCDLRNLHENSRDQTSLLPLSPFCNSCISPQPVHIILGYYDACTPK
jgi:hypothetical protein